MGGAVTGILPVTLRSALGIAIYGMFLAIIIPPARKSRVIAGVVAVSFLLSYLAGCLPALAGVSSGIKTIVLTVAIALGAAILFPVKEGADGQ